MRGRIPVLAVGPALVAALAVGGAVATPGKDHRGPSANVRLSADVVDVGRNRLILEDARLSMRGIARPIRTKLRRADELALVIGPRTRIRIEDELGDDVAMDREQLLDLVEELLARDEGPDTGEPGVDEPELDGPDTVGAPETDDPGAGPGVEGDELSIDARAKLSRRALRGVRTPALLAKRLTLYVPELPSELVEEPVDDDPELRVPEDEITTAGGARRGRSGRR